MTLDKMGILFSLYYAHQERRVDPDEKWWLT
jgi:hypothetical protein